MLSLFHIGYEEIRKPDIHYGRKNADFGQGFYLSDNGDFAGKWARERNGSDIFLNVYELDPSGLQILRFQREEAWLEYILRNRAGYADRHPEADVIVGPIANDTLYNTFGMITSGLFSREETLKMLQIGPQYMQTVIKTERAAAQLTWVSSHILDHKEAEHFREQVRQEEEAYQKAIAEMISG